jgi:hypothetical protein
MSMWRVPTLMRYTAISSVHAKSFVHNISMKFGDLVQLLLVHGFDEGVQTRELGVLNA